MRRHCHEGLNAPATLHLPKFTQDTLSTVPESIPYEQRPGGSSLRLRKNDETLQQRRIPEPMVDAYYCITFRSTGGPKMGCRQL